MKRTYLAHAAVAALIAVAAVNGKWVTTDAHAQAPQNTQVSSQARSLPTFEVDKSWPKLPPQYKLGDVSSMASDAQGNIYVLHRPRTLKDPDFAKAAPPVVVFDNDGNFLRAWGGDGQGYEWPQREHGIYIDNKGMVWVSGNNCSTNNLPRLKPVADDQLLKFTPEGKFVMQIGHSNQSKGNADTQNVHRAADLQVYPPTNELFVSDGYGNHRVVVFDADTGAFKRMWGAFGNKPADDDHCDVVRVTDFGPPGSQQFSIVHSLRVANDGMVYVADRENRRVQSFTNDGKFVKQLIKADTPFARAVALSPDQAQQYLYVDDGPAVDIVDRKSLEMIGQIKPPGTLGGHLITTDPKGNIYVAATGMGLQKLTYKGMAPPAVR
jgi:DNA-binding beta-propeller fold protein YncE